LSRIKTTGGNGWVCNQQGLNFGQRKSELTGAILMIAVNLAIH
jgi:hypothetical protein